MYFYKHQVESIREVLFETELKFCSKVTSFRSQKYVWLRKLVTLEQNFNSVSKRTSLID